VGACILLGDAYVKEQDRLDPKEEKKVKPMTKEEMYSFVCSDCGDRFAVSADMHGHKRKTCPALKLKEAKSKKRKWDLIDDDDDDS
jgi:hypothetical protein